jgi:hypothetical protein
LFHFALNQNLTLNYTDSSLPSSTTFNEFAQMVLEKLYPNAIYIVKDGVFQVSVENTPTVTGLYTAESQGHTGWANTGSNYLNNGVGGNEYSAKQTTTAIENVLGKKLKIRWSHLDGAPQVSERTITDDSVYVSILGFNASGSVRGYACANATKQTSFSAYTNAQSWYGTYGITMGTTNETSVSRIYDIWIE